MTLELWGSHQSNCRYDYDGNNSVTIDEPYHLSKTLSSKKLLKITHISCNTAVRVVSYYGAVKSQTLALMQEVATRSVALPRNGVSVFLWS